MRRARIKVDPESGDAFYHLISRTVNGEWLLGTAGKEVLRRQIWQLAEYTGIEVLTYAILSNHFHILVRVPKRESLSDEELLRRHQVLYPKPTQYQPANVQALRALLQENGPEAESWRKRQLRLMNDVSAYMKLVKERFSIWHNKTHRRYGPVWSDRFKSVLIEPDGRALESVAAYIDLNSVRAGIVNDPKDYRFCGYAEAVAGREKAREGIGRIMSGAPWADTHAEYRKLLFTVGSESRGDKATISEMHLAQVLRDGGKLPLSDVLRCRIRYFSAGAVLGSKAFVDLHLARFRERTGVGGRMSPRALPPITDWGQLTGLRNWRGAFLG